MKISAIIITRNEAGNIVDCIKSVHFVDEIIVIDNGSKDETISLAKNEGARIFQVTGLDFSYLRNLGKEKAASDWLLYIDADERVTEKLALEICNAVKKSDDISAFSLNRQNYYLGVVWPKIEKMVRLMKKEALIGWQGSLHESPLISGKIDSLSSILLHYTHKDLSSMLAKTNEWSEVEAALRFQSGHPPMTWWRFIRVIITAFYQTYIKGEGWKMGTVGLIEGIYQAFSLFVTYAKLWEKQNENRHI